MPKFSFKCNTCNNVLQKFITDMTIVSTECPSCKSEMQRQLPNLSGNAEVKETVDSHTGVKWHEDQQKMINDRKRTYFWSVEVPRMVNSGVYSIETMLENGWVYFDERGTLITRTKPPEAQ